MSWWTVLFFQRGYLRVVSLGENIVLQLWSVFLVALCVRISNAQFALCVAAWTDTNPQETTLVDEHAVWSSPWCSSRAFKQYAYKHVNLHAFGRCAQTHRRQQCRGIPVVHRASVNSLGGAAPKLFTLSLQCSILSQLCSCRTVCRSILYTDCKIEPLWAPMRQDVRMRQAQLIAVVAINQSVYFCLCDKQHPQLPSCDVC